jgi:hypothetical protein
MPEAGKKKDRFGEGAGAAGDQAGRYKLEKLQSATSVMNEVRSLSLLRGVPIDGGAARSPR